MHEVRCPSCRIVRQVKAKKTWMKGEPPFTKRCMSCTQKGKKKSEDHKAKISQSVKRYEATSVAKQRKTNLGEQLFREGRSNLIPGAGGGWNAGLELGQRDEETRKKIAESMKGRNGK